MNLTITDNNGTVQAEFEGSPEEAIFAIATIITQEPMLGAILETAVLAAKEMGAELRDNIDTASIQKSKKVVKDGQ